MRPTTLLARTTLSASLLLGAIAVNGCGSCSNWGNSYSQAQYPHVRTDTIRIAHHPDARIHATTVAGSLEIIEDPTLSEVVIEYELRAESLEVLNEAELLATYDTRDLIESLHIRAEGPKANRGWSKPFYLERLSVRVPSAPSVRAETGAGDIVVTGLGAGPLAAKSVLSAGSGSVTLRDHNAPALVETGSGEIDVHEQSGDLVVRAGSGEITIRGGSGQTKVFTGSGDIVVSGRSGWIDADAGSGDVELRSVDRHFSVSTGSGDVDVVVVPGWRGRCSVSTGSGHSSIEPMPAADGSQPLSRIDTGSGDAMVRVAETGT